MKRKMPYQQPQMLIVKITSQHMLSQSQLRVQKSDDENYWGNPEDAD